MASGLQVPWGIDFLPDGSALVTERDTERVFQVGDGAVTRVGELGQTEPDGEGGLLGVAVSPSYDEDSTVFFYLTTGDDNRVVKATFRGGRLGEATPVLTDIPKNSFHDGGRLLFGPDDMLYVSTGDAGDTDTAQDLESLGGKILRITPEGEPAPGNPDPESPVWSYGHRNVQGLAFDDAGPAVGLGVRRPDLGRAQPDRGGRQLRLARGRGARRRRRGGHRAAGAVGHRRQLPVGPGLRRRPAVARRAAGPAAVARGRRRGSGPRTRAGSSSATTAGSAPWSPPPTGGCG